MGGVGMGLRLLVLAEIVMVGGLMMVMSGRVMVGGGLMMMLTSWMFGLRHN
jgi:hypothetical protein